MEKFSGYNGLDRRRYIRFDVKFPITLNLSIPSKTGIMKVVIDTETINVSLNGICFNIGFSDYIDIIPLIEAAKKNSEIGISVEVLAEWRHFEYLGKIEWFRPVDENHVSIGIQLKSIQGDDRRMWDKMLSSLRQKM